jgi:hypothetical protein
MKFTVDRQNTTAPVFFRVYKADGVTPMVGYNGGTMDSGDANGPTEFTNYISVSADPGQLLMGMAEFNNLITANNTNGMVLECYVPGSSATDRFSVLKVQDGATGNYRQFVYKRGIVAPSAPTGNGPIPLGGWSDAPPPDDGTFLWMSSAELTAANLIEGRSWTTPVQVTSPGMGNWTVIHKSANTVTPAAGTVRKVAGGWGWNNAGAYSGEFYVGGCTASFKAPQTNKGLMAGITTTPGVLNYTSIDYAVYLTSAGTVKVFEKGVNISDFGAYAAGDTFLVTFTDGTVKYYKNGVLLYTSTAVPSMNDPFFFDTEFLDVDGELDNVSLVGSGAVGLRPDVKFIRSNATPATPTGNSPTGWTDGVPSGTDRLWQIRGNKNGAGNLVGVWSPPAIISGVVFRGVYDAGTVYYPNDSVTYSGGTYINTNQSVGNDPSGTDQATGYWDVLAAPGIAPPPAGAGDLGTSAARTTINIASTNSSVNLRTLANAAGYGGGNAYINFVVSASAIINGTPGQPAIDTGSWPSGKTISLNLTISSSAQVNGGRGSGGLGVFGGNSQGGSGGAGGAGINLQVNIGTFTNSGTVRGGGGGGGGGGGSSSKFGDDIEGGGGGSGAGGTGTGLATTGAVGSAGTSSGGGTSGTGGTGGAYGTAGSVGGSGTAPVGGFAAPGGSGGAAGPSVRKNGKTMTTNGTLVGAVVA